MHQTTTHRSWYLDGTTVHANASTRQRIDTYELGMAALAAIELEEEFPGVAVSTRLRRAEAIHQAALLTV